MNDCYNRKAIFILKKTMNTDKENLIPEWLINFKREDSSDISFDLYRNFSNSEDGLKKYWEMFSDFYYISCYPFDGNIEKWKDMPQIYSILQRCTHMANGHPLEILIGKYSEETMEKARKITEERRKEFEWTKVRVWDPKSYMHIVGFFGGTMWRNNQEIIRQIRQAFPNKVKKLTP